MTAGKTLIACVALLSLRKYPHKPSLSRCLPIYLDNLSSWRYMKQNKSLLRKEVLESIILSVTQQNS